ncbi:hypothetical protein ACOMHN_036749 [Nucella lapillus]
MAATDEFDYFGTCWRSPQRSDQPSAFTDCSMKSQAQSSIGSPASDIVSPAMAASPPITTIGGTLTMAGMAKIIASVNGSANPFSVGKATSSASGSSSVSRGTSGSDRERRTSQKSSGGGGSSASSGEHSSVKGGKTAKRGKGVKLKVLSFSDIENGFSCFGQSASSWADTLGDISSDRLLTLSDQQETNYAWADTGGGAGKRSKISHPSPSGSTASWDIDGGLAADFDGSFSGLGTELGTSSYNMSEALLALPVFKQENLENGFQYILGAATSPAVKMNEETLTYLNQGQSYEIKVKKLGDLSQYQGKCLRSVLKVFFHERRLQYMEKEHVDLWKQGRPGERILDLDLPLSYGLADVTLDSSRINRADFTWDPTKETGLYLKGVVFRIHMETYSTAAAEEETLLHAASCQVKVFKPKGADRKHKTDREKMEKRSEAEKEKFQPSYECTVLTEVPLDQVVPNQSSFGLKGSSSSLGSSFSELSCNTAASGAVPSSPLPISGTTPPGCTPSRPLPTSPHTPPSVQPHHHPHPHPHPLHSPGLRSGPSPPAFLGSGPSHPAFLGSAGDFASYPMLSEATATEVQNWLVCHRFSSYTRVFQQFSGADLLRLARDDLIKICGLADGIRLDNALQARSVRPRLTIFICQEPESVYHAVYLQSVAVQELRGRLAALFVYHAVYLQSVAVQELRGRLAALFGIHGDDDDDDDNNDDDDDDHDDDDDDDDGDVCSVPCSVPAERGYARAEGQAGGSVWYHVYHAVYLQSMAVQELRGRLADLFVYHAVYLQNVAVQELRGWLAALFGIHVYHAVYLQSVAVQELRGRLAALFGIHGDDDDDDNDNDDDDDDDDDDDNDDVCSVPCSVPAELYHAVYLQSVAVQELRGRLAALYGIHGDDDDDDNDNDGDDDDDDHDDDDYDDVCSVPCSVPAECGCARAEGQAGGSVWYHVYHAVYLQSVAVQELRGRLAALFGIMVMMITMMMMMCAVYHAVYLQSVAVQELRGRLAALFSISPSHVGDIFLLGPSGIHIMVSDEVLRNTQDQSRYMVQGVKDEMVDKYRILFKAMH